MLIPVLTQEKKQLSAAEVALSRKLCRARIHVERALRRLKSFPQLSDMLPIYLFSKSDDADMYRIDKALIV